MDDSSAGQQTTAAGRYSALEADKFAVLQRARDASRLTIPALVPPSGTTNSSFLPTPYQSVGARGTNNLASKLLLSLFPPNQPFFRLVIGDYDIERILKGNVQAKALFDEALSKIEREVQSYIEQSAVRVSAFEAIKHLVVAGNALLFIRPDGSIRVYHLIDYVVRRDPQGNVEEIITKECIAPEAMPPEIQAEKTESSANPGPGANKTIELYTWVKRTTRKWTVHQEIKGQVVPKSQGTYPLDKSPWLALRWTKVDGEDYGRGFIEEYQGDLQSLEGLSQAIVQAAAASAKVLFLVKPNGTTKLKTIAESPNGAVREGNAEDVHCLQVEKQADLAVAKQALDDIEKRLSFAFLLNSAVQRDAERVTSAEIRYMAQELETSLGGLYSILSQEFQLPLVKVLMAQLQRSKRLPVLPEGAVKPTIVTGLEALGRGNDLDKLNQFIQELAPLGPQVIAQYLQVDTYMTLVATSIGIDTSNLVKSSAQVQQEQAAAQQAAMQAQGMQELMKHGAQQGAQGLKEIAVHHATSGGGQAAPAQTPPASAGPAPSPADGS